MKELKYLINLGYTVKFLQKKSEYQVELYNSGGSLLIIFKDEDLTTVVSETTMWALEQQQGE